jgi:cytochrome d ubiquinol oxidase subunit II
MFSLEFLQIAFFLVFGTAVIFYAVLDGFDLGTGMIHLFNKDDYERRIFLNAIGPVWDGNSVWIVIVLGTLFAGFPAVFSVLLSSFYMLVMLLILGLMLRAVAIEFRSKTENVKWRSFWDITFSYASYLIAFGVGTCLGNLVTGIPIDENLNFQAGLFLSFRPYPILIGLLTVVLFSMHGSIYLCMKTEGALHQKLRNWVSHYVYAFMAILILVTLATFASMPHMSERLLEMPVLFIFPVLSFLSLTQINRFFKKGKDLIAFGFSSFSIVCLFITFGLGAFPNLVRSTIDDSYSLTVYNASSSQLTLGVLMVVVAVGIPLFLVYGATVYRIFRGKVKITDLSY